MLQAPTKLRKMFADDGVALEVLEKHFIEKRGLIRPKVQGYKPTRREWHAINYLFLEWDYAYSPTYEAQPGSRLSGRG